MFRAFTVATRLAIGAVALSLAAFLPAHLPGGAISSVRADATLIVDSTGDEGDGAPGDGACAIALDGPCTLRAAIQEANALSGNDTIHFNLPPAGGYVIAPTSALPAMVGSLVIDATTQPGYSGQPLIELDGRNAGQASGLSVSTWYDYSLAIRGLAISRFAVYGISVAGRGNTVIQGNVIESNGGPDQSGRPRGGIYVDEGGATIGGASLGAANVIARNLGHGIVLGRFSGATISGNSIYDNAGQGIFLECRRLAVGPCGHQTRPYPRRNVRRAHGRQHCCAWYQPSQSTSIHRPPMERYFRILCKPHN